MIFQDPLSALHPFYRVGPQIVEAIRAHLESPSSGRRRAIDLLERVGIPEAGRASTTTHTSSPAACASG